MVEIYDRFNTPFAAITYKTIPLKDWCRLVLLFKSNKVIV